MKIIYEHIGLVIVFTGIVHCLTGIASLLANVSHRLSALNEREYLGWFLLAGISLILMGISIDWIVRVQRLKMPVSFCIGFLIMSLVTVSLVPKSGGWLVLLEAVLLAAGTFIY